MVPKGGLEPPRSYPLPPQGSASTNSATWAWSVAAMVLHSKVSTVIPDKPAKRARSGICSPGRKEQIIRRILRLTLGRSASPMFVPASCLRSPGSTTMKLRPPRNDDYKETIVQRCSMSAAARRFRFCRRGGLRYFAVVRRSGGLRRLRHGLLRRVGQRMHVRRSLRSGGGRGSWRDHSRHHAQIRLRFLHADTAEINAHRQTQHEEQTGQHRGGAREKTRRSARTEYRRRRAAAEAGAGVRAGAALQEDQHDHRRGDQDIENAENGEEHGGFRRRSARRCTYGE